MQESIALVAESSIGSAFTDTIIDEYYDDVAPGGIEATYASLQENPYPGLRPFKTSESIVFFGRTGISSEIIKRLSANRFLAVLGASGTGKSSLIRAGLLPTLDILPGRHGRWKVVICRPGKNPFGNFAQAIAKSGIAKEQSVLDIWKITSSSSYGYEKLRAGIDDKEDYNTLIVIDQFEEMFRYRESKGVSGKNDASLFVKMLVDISSNLSLNTYVIITMRSEYLGDCIQFPDLAEAINEGQYLLPRLKPAQLREAIESPTAFSDGGLEPQFAARLAAEIGDNMDQLPVLQHALRRSYEKAKIRTKLEHPDGETRVEVRYSDYVAAGRIQKALNEHANEIYSGLTKKQQDYAIILFQCITDKTTDGKGTRRPLSLSTIAYICSEQYSQQYGITFNDKEFRADLEAVINKFREENVNFLMPARHVELRDELKIDISHESLMRIWSLLKDWIDNEAVNAHVLKELLDTNDMRQYLTGGKLSSYAEWKKKKNPGIQWAGLYKPPDIAEDVYEKNFHSGVNLISKSEKRKKRKLYSSLGIVALVITGISGIALFYLSTTIKLDKKTKELEYLNVKQTKDQKVIQDQNNDLTAQKASLNLANDKLESSVKSRKIANDSLLAQNGIIDNQKKQLQAEVENRNKALDQLRSNKATLQQSFDAQTRLNENLNNTQHELTQTLDSANKLKNFAVAIKSAQKSSGIRAFDPATKKMKSNLAVEALASFKNSISKDDRNNGDLFQPVVYDALYDAVKSKQGSDTNRNVWYPNQANKRVTDLAFASAKSKKNNGSIYLATENKFVYKIDAATGEVKSKTALDKMVLNIEESAEGKWLAVQTPDTVLYLKNNEGDGQTSSLHFPKVVSAIAFSPDEKFLYSFAGDSIIYETNLNEPVRNNTITRRPWKKINVRLNSMAVSATTIYGLTSKGQVIEWSRNDAGRETIVPMHYLARNNPSRGTKIIYNAVNKMVVWGNEKGQVFYMLTDTVQSQYLTNFSAAVSDIAFSPGQQYLAISSFDKTVSVYKLPDLSGELPVVLKDNKEPVTAVFFTPDNKLAAVMGSGVIKLYELNLEKLAAELRPGGK